MLKSDPPPFPFFFHLLHAIERLFVWSSVHKEREVYAAADFPWTRDLEMQWKVIRAELERVLERRDLIPNFQEISPEQTLITRDDKWKTHVLWAYGARAERNCRDCPQTAAAVARIPGMKTAFFSILSGGKQIPAHRGPYKGLLRCHLGLVVPQPVSDFRMRVGKTELFWEEGKALIFDDTYVHQVWNTSHSERVVLFIDFVRPMRFPMSWINAAILQLIVHSPYGRQTLRRFKRWYAQRGIDIDG